MYGISLSEDEVRKMAGDLIALYRAVFGDPLQNNKSNKDGK